jgi:hypothetical protein
MLLIKKTINLKTVYILISDVFYITVCIIYIYILNDPFHVNFKSAIQCGCAAEISKTPQCIYCYQMKPEFTCYNIFDNLDAIG